MTNLKDFTLVARKEHHITNVKKDGDFYKIDYLHLDFDKNTSEPSTIMVENNGGAKLSLMLHLSEMGYL
jgi:hypothetical protein